MTTALDTPAADDRLQILVGDALHTLPRLAPGSVHCVVTSPPYWGVRDYGTAPLDWPEVTYAPMPGLPTITVPAMRCSLGLEPTPEAFVAHVVLVFRAVHRVLRDDGTAWVNFGDSYAGAAGGGQGKNGRRASRRTLRIEVEKRGAGLKPKDLIGMPWRVAFALQADGWYLRVDNVWNKPNPMPESIEDRPTKAHEYVFLLAKRGRYFYDRDAIRERCSPNTHSRGKGVHPKMAAAGSGIKANASWSAATRGHVSHRNKRTVWTVATRPYAGAHFAVFPPDIVVPCVLAGTSARGCCPACGAPWTRVLGERVVLPGPGAGNKDRRLHTAGERGRIATHRGSSVPWKPGASTTAGWASSCACTAGDPVPCTVLDPFGGSGTTAAVALAHGRRAVLCELNADYVPLIHNRVALALRPAVPRGARPRRIVGQLALPGADAMPVTEDLDDTAE